MEPDRYQQSHGYFITGIVCLLLSMLFFGLCIYLLPNLLFGLHYSMPDGLVDVYAYFLSSYQLSEKGAMGAVFSIFLLLALLNALIAYIASNHIDNKIHNLEEEKALEWTARKKSISDSGRVFVKILVIVGVVFATSLLFQWVIASPQTPEY